MAGKSKPRSGSSKAAVKQEERVPERSVVFEGSPRLVVTPVVEESRVVVSVGSEQRALEREQVFELQRTLRAATGVRVQLGEEKADLSGEQVLELQRRLQSAAAAAF